MFVVKWLMLKQGDWRFCWCQYRRVDLNALLSLKFWGNCAVLQQKMFLAQLRRKARSRQVVTMMYGTGIGVVSSLAGIGGGSMSVPFLNKHGIKMRKAVGSHPYVAAIAISGMIGFIFTWLK